MGTIQCSFTVCRQQERNLLENITSWNQANSSQLKPKCGKIIFSRDYLLLSLENNLLIMRGIKHISYIFIFINCIKKRSTREYLSGMCRSVPSTLGGTITIMKNNIQFLPSRSFLERDWYYTTSHIISYVCGGMVWFSEISVYLDL